MKFAKKAFTLVELLVVIAIIALLVSMLMPALRKARTAALAVQCQSNLRQIGAAFFNYATDNRDHIPGHGYANPFFNDTRGATFYHILGKSRYLGSMEEFRGPMAGIWSTRFAATRCPAEIGGAQYGMNGQTFFESEFMAGSYVMNYSVIHHAHYLGYGGGPAYKCYRKGFLRGPETMPAHEARLVVDTPDWGPFWVITYYDYLIDAPLTGSYPDTNYAFRHPGRTLNALYMDGHVEAVAHYSKTGKYVYQVLWNAAVP